ncbi:MAG TPA: ABC transporter permease [Cyclobacteriaceae bacterium]|nr:ABC transporter permease [Cyclobacteriaceae bacterium]
MNPDIKPPKLAGKIFTWYCNRTANEDFHGDLEELFYKDLRHHSIRKAKFLYWKGVFSFIFSYAMRQRKRRSAYHMFSSTTLTPIMFVNYVKTASRNLAKHKFFTILNVFGLSLGMSVTLVFIAMLAFIFTYDNFHTGGERIYRVTTQVLDKDRNLDFASAPAGLAQKLETELPGVEKAIPIQKTLNGDALYNEKKIALNGYFTSPDFLTVFSFPLLKGNAATALSNPQSIVITETEATKIFGTKDPMGEVITIEPYGDFAVTGILKDLPKNSHMTFKALASRTASMALESEQQWKDFANSYVYFLLSEHTSPSDVERYMAGVAEEKYKGQSFEVTFSVQPLNKIVPGPGHENEIGISWGFLAISLFAWMPIIILVPACTNYVNLSISRSLTRMKEIGVRKVMGGQKQQIFFQFIFETTITMLIALVLSYLIFEMIRGEFLQLVGRSNSLDLAPTVTTVLCFILFAFLVAFFAGAVPAIYFSKIKPVVALKGKPETTRRSNSLPLRKIVITAQFVLSLAFIMVIVVMLQQYRYSVNFDFGFEQQRVLDVGLQGVDHNIVKNEFTKLSTVERVSMSSHLVGLGFTPGRYVLTADKSDSVEIATMSIDENFISNAGLSIIAGRNFSERPTENANVVIVNEELIKKLKLGDALSAVDKTILLADGQELRIGGVIKNFHYSSITVPIGSFFFEYDPSRFQYANVKLTPGTDFSDIESMATTWTKIGGETKFNAKFFSDELQDAYSFYLDFVKMFGFLGVLAITVACLGMLGTIVFIIRNRLKEVSIRKVMGASSESLVMLLSKDFVIIMVVAAVVTVPGVFWLLKNLLLPSISYYIVDIGALEIAISLTIMVALGMGTVLSQTLKAANANPVDNLRNE